MADLKTKRRERPGGGALTVCSRTFSGLKTVKVAGVSPGMMGNTSGHSSSRGADGCSHVGFVVLVLLRGSSTSLHGFSTPLSSFYRNHVTASPKQKDKTKTAASLPLKTVNVA